MKIVNLGEKEMRKTERDQESVEEPNCGCSMMAGLRRF